MTRRPVRPAPRVAFASRVTFALLVASAMLVATSAGASESYPNAIERALDTPCPPDCTTCHTTRSGGSLTANTPVGISARRAGLECCDRAQLLDVLGTLETNMTDSDSDGTPDVDELRAGTDPNALEGKLECYVPPAEDACAASPRSARRNGGTGAVATALALLACVTARARRRGR
jgi:hypothetical protein